MNINNAADSSILSLQKLIILTLNSYLSNSVVSRIALVIPDLQFFTGNVSNVSQNMAYGTSFNIISLRLVSPGNSRKIINVFCNITDCLKRNIGSDFNGCTALSFIHWNHDIHILSGHTKILTKLSDYSIIPFWWNLSRLNINGK